MTVDLKHFKQVLEQGLIHSFDKDIIYLIENWPKIAQQYAVYSLPVQIKLKQKTLILVCDAGYSMNMLYEQEKICHLINQHFKKPLINKILIRNKLTGDTDEQNT